jgi:uncharacterized protein YndB with AHSA1/START domain
MNTPMTTPRTLTIERQLPYPPEKIWRALTEGSLIQEWLMDNDFQAVVGHRFHFRSTPVAGWDGVIESEVQTVEANKKLSYSWDTMGLATVVVWTLEATPGGTMLRMEQTGLEKEANYKGAMYGWQKFIGGLERVVGGLQ